jgi:hypothetical protein
MTASFAAALFWLSVVCCVVAEVAIVRATLRVSRLSAEPAATPSGTTTLPRPRRALELLWVILPALALAAVLGATWRTVSAPPVIQLHGDGMTHESHP